MTPILLRSLLLIGFLFSANSLYAQRPAHKLESVEKVVAKHISEGTVAGAVTLISEDGKLVHFGVQGKANIEQDREMQRNTMFAIASMTKPITATGLMILVEQGKVNLDDPVSKYVPEFADVKLNGNKLEEPITVKQCLTHTAGLAGSQIVKGSLEETVKEIASRPLAYKPGTKWQYSPGMTVIGRIIEVASGKPYEVFLHQRIFKPLGMVDTTFSPTADQKKRVATIYKTEKDGSLTENENWIARLESNNPPNPSGGLYSTAKDLNRYYAAMLDENELRGFRPVKIETAKKMRTIQTDDLVTGFTPGNGWGLGFCVIREPQGTTEALSPGTFGHGGAFGTQGWIDPETERIFILLVQRSNFNNADNSTYRKEIQNAAVAELDAK